MRLIDADELIKALNSNCKPELCYDYKTAWCVACCPHNDFVDLLDNAPTVEPFEKVGAICNENCGMTRPHGKWNDKKVAFYLECSNCGALVSGYQPNIFLENEKLNYCPNCGADMRQEESE